jgi:hypothetical protein
MRHQQVGELTTPYAQSSIPARVEAHGCRREVRARNPVKGVLMSDKLKEDPSRRLVLKRALVVLGASAIVQPVGGVWAADDEGGKKKKKKKKKSGSDSK